nr:SDR family NAD(P)-dependent oxidoreductase [Pontibacter liquoris]
MKGRKALISGGASGIGRAIAARLIQEEVATALADLHLPGEAPPATKTFRCDVTSGPDVDTLFAGVQASIGAPDILVCSAGRGIHEKLTEGDPAKWQQAIEVNLLGALRMIRAFVPGMVAEGQGDVVLISSVAAGQAYTYDGVYGASKAALEVIAETLRLEVLPLVRVTVIAPGVTDTPFFEHTISGSHTAAAIGFGAISPEVVADAVLYALRQPKGVSVNRITVRPTAQPF